MWSVTELRKQQKKRCGEYLKQFTSSPQFESSFHRLIGQKYKLIQYESRYKHESLQILSYQFSSIGGTNHAKILQISVNDHYRSLSLELDHLSQTGLGMLIIDKNNNVCFISYMFDQCDLPIFNIENTKYHKKHEICTAAIKNDPIYQKLILSQQNTIKYGDILIMDKAALRPDLRGKGFMSFDLAHILGILLRYKYVYTLETNPYTISIGNQLTKNDSFIISWKRTSYFDFSHFKFEDRSNIDQYYNIKKLKKRNFEIGVLFGIINSKSFSFQEVVEEWLEFCKILKNMKFTRHKSKI